MTFRKSVVFVLFPVMLAFALGASAGFLPFWLDSPSRSNIHDPKNSNFIQPTRTPLAFTATITPTFTASPGYTHTDTPTNSPTYSNSPTFSASPTPSSTFTSSPTYTPCVASQKQDFQNFESGSDCYDYTYNDSGSGGDSYISNTAATGTLTNAMVAPPGTGNSSAYCLYTQAYLDPTNPKGYGCGFGFGNDGTNDVVAGAGCGALQNVPGAAPNVTCDYEMWVLTDQNIQLVVTLSQGSYPCDTQEVQMNSADGGVPVYVTAQAGVWQIIDVPVAHFVELFPSPPGPGDSACGTSTGTPIPALPWNPADGNNGSGPGQWTFDNVDIQFMPVGTSAVTANVYFDNIGFNY